MRPLSPCSSVTFLPYVLLQHIDSITEHFAYSRLGIIHGGIREAFNLTPNKAPTASTTRHLRPPTYPIPLLADKFSPILFFDTTKTGTIRWLNRLFEIAYLLDTSSPQLPDTHVFTCPPPAILDAIRREPSEHPNFLVEYTGTMVSLLFPSAPFMSNAPYLSLLTTPTPDQTPLLRHMVHMW